MKTLDIEWKHLEKDGDTCLRCAGTGKTLKDVVTEMQARCRSLGVSITLREVSLPADRICESNSIRFNGVLLEELLSGATPSKSYCGSCSDLTGTETYCRTVERDGRTYEEIPEELIWEAACRAVDCDLRKADDRNA
jgi:hypothetical protein